MVTYFKGTATYQPWPNLYKCLRLSTCLQRVPIYFMQNGQRSKSHMHLALTPVYTDLTLSNPAVGETVLTPVKWCCNTGEVPIRIKKRWTNRHLVKNYYFLVLYKRLQ